MPAHKKDLLFCQRCKQNHPRENIIFDGNAKYCKNCYEAICEKRALKKEFIQNTSGSKTCSNCKIEKPLTEFPKCASIYSTDGFDTMCKTCKYPTDKTMLEPILSDSVIELEIKDNHKINNNIREFRDFVDSWCYLTIDKTKYIRVEYIQNIYDFNIPESKPYFAIFNAIVDYLKTIHNNHLVNNIQEYL